MANSFEDFQDLSNTGYQGGGTTETLTPEEEMFHSIYIAGQSRKNHINVMEESGKLQIRGVEYNLDEVHMVITHTKDILVKERYINGKGNTMECFSYKSENPWVGTDPMPDGSQRVCPQTSAERAVNNHCAGCKAQIIVAGVLCSENGKPIIGENGKPAFGFLRAKGTKYQNVSEYLSESYNLEGLTPIFTPVTPQSTAFEKTVVNNKRHVVKISKDYVNTRHGSTVSVFKLVRGKELSRDEVLNVLKLSKKVLSDFDDKFDWAKRKAASASTANSYGGTSSPGLTIPEEPATDHGMGTPVDAAPTSESSNSGDGGGFVSFENIDF